jgi:hypothetical protein
MENDRPTLAAVKLMLPAVRRVWGLLEADIRERVENRR